MTLFRSFHAFAAERGDGLRPEIQRLLNRAAIDSRFATTIRQDGMLQSGPDPKSESEHTSEAPPRRQDAQHSNAADPDADSVVQLIQKETP